MSELADCAIRAISGKAPQAFKILRKLAACGVVLSAGGSGTNAAALADNAIFQKKTEYDVGQGVISAEQAVEAMTDRKTSIFSTIIRIGIKSSIAWGCSALGGVLGTVFGPPGTWIGKAIGAGVGTLVSKTLGTVIEKGGELIKPVAKSIFEKGKEMLKSVGGKLKRALHFVGIIK